MKPLNCVARFVIISVILLSLLNAGPCFAQRRPCPQQPYEPLLKYAHDMYQAARTDCAAYVLDSIIANNLLDKYGMASAHMFRAYLYLLEADTLNQKMKIGYHIRQAYEAYSDWRDFDSLPPNNIISFERIVDSVHNQIMQEYADSLAAVSSGEKASGKWYKKWYSIASGAAVVVILYLVLKPSNDHENIVDTSGGEFPPPPGNSKPWARPR